MNRLNGLFTSLAFLLILRLFGFESGEVPGSQPNQAARFLMTVFPIFMMILSLGVSFLIHFPEIRPPMTASEPATLEGGGIHGSDQN
jgi:GPH family glycoside/pentoside/hexuronide:cation symporter